MNGALYIFGDPKGPPFKVGASEDAKRRYFQHLYVRGGAIKTIQRLGLDVDLQRCRYLHLWDVGHPGHPRGLEGGILESLKSYRLRVNGSTNFTEWVDLPLNDLHGRICSHPWMHDSVEVDLISFWSELAPLSGRPC
jgi:hypothetical protein